MPVSIPYFISTCIYFFSSFFLQSKLRMAVIHSSMMWMYSEVWCLSAVCNVILLCSNRYYALADVSAQFGFITTMFAGVSCVDDVVRSWHSIFASLILVGYSCFPHVKRCLSTCSLWLNRDTQGRLSSIISYVFCVCLTAAWKWFAYKDYSSSLYNSYCIFYVRWVLQSCFRWRDREKWIYCCCE